MRHENRGESDQVFWVYSRDFGKIAVMAKGIRKLNSKLRGSTQVFYLSEIEFVQGRGRKTLVDAVRVEKFAGLRESFLKLRLAHRFVRIFCHLVKSPIAEEALWQRLSRFFSEIDGASFLPNKAQLFYYFSFWRLLTALGYRPELYRCVFCRRKIAAPETFWQSRDGGLICRNCSGRSAPRPRSVSAPAIKIIRFFLTHEWPMVRRLKAEPLVLREIKVISQNYFYHH